MPWDLTADNGEWNTDLVTLRGHMRESGTTGGINSGFDRWRARQARRMSHELDARTVQAIPNALVAYELSRGCSMGCRFCGVSASKFVGNQAYDDESSRLWHGMLEAMAARFGGAAATGFCYWATDPADNPDYLKFANDHLKLTGGRPQITTAAPFKSPALLKTMFGSRHPSQHAPDRVSILSVRTLDALHKAYEAHEMLHVDLVMQTAGSLMSRAQAGRQLTASKRRTIETSAPSQQSTIACVVGFLINLPERRLRMIAPCRADQAHQDGFITFDDTVFANVSEFGDALDRMLNDVVQDTPGGDVHLRFNPAVEVIQHEGVFLIRSAGQQGQFPPFPFLHRMAELIGSERFTTRELLSTLGSEYPTQMIAIGAMLQDMFDHGLLIDRGSSSNEYRNRDLSYA